MAVREIVTLPHPILRRKARKVTGFGSELQTLLDDMIETMRAAPGVGLAANQVNVPLQVIVVEYPEDDEKEDSPPRLYTIINPVITRTSQETALGTEGCLSVPGIIGEVERAEVITVKGQNRRGQPLTIKAKGWLARIFQHEIDHLEGVLFVDRAEKVHAVDTEAGQVAPDNV
jgi:peptide deformylase